LLLLHGDTFGYISEFDQFIPLLAKHFKVIAAECVGMENQKSERKDILISYLQKTLWPY
jgi:hypothetical protein